MPVTLRPTETNHHTLSTPSEFLVGTGRPIHTYAEDNILTNCVGVSVDRFRRSSPLPHDLPPELAIRHRQATGR